MNVRRSGRCTPPTPCHRRRVVGKKVFVRLQFLFFSMQYDLTVFSFQSFLSLFFLGVAGVLFHLVHDLKLRLSVNGTHAQCHATLLVEHGAFLFKHQIQILLVKHHRASVQRYHGRMQPKPGLFSNTGPSFCNFLFFFSGHFLAHSKAH